MAKNRSSSIMSARPPSRLVITLSSSTNPLIEALLGLLSHRNAESLPATEAAPPNQVGSEPLDHLGYTIWKSVGPSGPNKEYLYKLVESVRELSPDSYDSHLYALESIVRELDKSQAQQ
ncbi:hypothetical protein D9613_001362 [Agrocybe pediades]|uniref:glutathione-specific gamma-glutamylcyclotransferase n=1 Tax=Agrocybe pediades TaxID=84607 RepID=A0A8H4VUN0_9AGAR|nr:hypothetical protein D9613_001362 [Agrocybe pediades]